MRKYLFNILILLSFVMLPLGYANGPQWWTERGAVDPNKSADDFAAANIGQLKFIATKAAEEMDEKLNGGAGSSIRALIAQWQSEPGEGVVRDDYGVLTIGQLKAIGKLFYDRLIAENVVTGYPWQINGEDPSNTAVANLGQVKTVFSFVITIDPSRVDSDGDGLPDAWELEHFQNLSRNGNEVLTQSGLRIIDAYRQGLNPNTVASDSKYNGSNNAVVITYKYNKRGELIEAKRNEDIHTFGYDGRGNITEK